MPAIWGLYDTDAEAWIGTDHGPVLFPNALLAEVAAQVTDTRLGHPPGRTQPAQFSETAYPMDSTARTIAALDALAKLARGE